MKSYFQCENKMPLTFQNITLKLNLWVFCMLCRRRLPSRAKHTLLNINIDNEKPLLWSTVCFEMLNTYMLARYNLFGKTSWFHIQGRVHGVTFQESVTLASSSRVQTVTPTVRTLYVPDQLRLLQSSDRRLIPRLKSSDDLEKLTAALRRARFNSAYLDDIPDNPILCTHGTHRCHHAAHAYTGIPCAAYGTWTA
jgi:hypothetical protein